MTLIEKYSVGGNELSMNKMKLLVAFIRKQRKVNETNLRKRVVFNVSIPNNILDEMISSGLIFIQEGFIEPNFVVIYKFYPWLLNSKIQDIILDLKDNSKSTNFGKIIQNTLYLLCKNQNGILQTELVEGIGSRDDIFRKPRGEMRDLGIFEIRHKGRNNVIRPLIFKINETESELSLIWKDGPAIQSSDIKSKSSLGPEVLEGYEPMDGKMMMFLVFLMVNNGVMTKQEIDQMPMNAEEIKDFKKKLKDLGLISIKTDGTVRVNDKKIKDQQPWLCFKEMRNIILKSIKHNPSFHLLPESQKALYLLCKYSEGLSIKNICSALKLTYSGFNPVFYNLKTPGIIEDGQVHNVDFIWFKFSGDGK